MRAKQMGKAKSLVKRLVLGVAQWKLHGERPAAVAVLVTPRTTEDTVRQVVHKLRSGDDEAEREALMVIPRVLDVFAELFVQEGGASALVELSNGADGSKLAHCINAMSLVLFSVAWAANDVPLDWVEAMLRAMAFHKSTIVRRNATKVVTQLVRSTYFGFEAIQAQAGSMEALVLPLREMLGPGDIYTQLAALDAFNALLTFAGPFEGELRYCMRQAQVTHAVLLMRQQGIGVDGVQTLTRRYLNIFERL